MLILLTFIITIINQLVFIIVEGFTEAKIDRFGQAIVEKVIEVCNKYPVEPKTEGMDQPKTK